MARKRGKRKGKHNDLAQAYSIYAPGKSKAEVFRAMIEGVRDGSGSLPAGVEVTWRWRNAKNKPWQEGDFESVVQDSGPKRGGFLKLMQARLERDAAKYAPGWKGATAEKRAAASKKGWETRRRKAAEREEKATKRSAAAKKGWKTRRANERARAKGRKKK